MRSEVPTVTDRRLGTHHAPKVNCRFKNKLLYFNTKQLNLFSNFN